ncbi:hypothetical protein BVY12_17605 [Pseudomonas amygdali pv. morsprunorum]|nr:hypothetical protein BVY12_17605 [Pseudomonas amygdali pv. morsprunorum]
MWASDHRSVPHGTLKRGRRASRTACDAERRTIIEIKACRRRASHDSRDYGMSAWRRTIVDAAR